MACAAFAFLAAAQLAFNAGWILAVVVPLVALAVSVACGATLIAIRAVRRMARSRSGMA